MVRSRFSQNEEAHSALWNIIPSLVLAKNRPVRGITFSYPLLSLYASHVIYMQAVFRIVHLALSGAETATEKV